MTSLGQLVMLVMTSAQAGPHDSLAAHHPLRGHLQPGAIQQVFQNSTDFFQTCPIAREFFLCDDVLSCRFQCGQPMSKSLFEEMPGMGSPLCSCDDMCVLYHDCCPGFKQHCPAEYQAGVNTFGRSDVSSRVGEHFGVEQFSVVVDCVNHADTSHDGSMSDAAFIGRDIAVTDRVNTIHYKNMSVYRCNQHRASRSSDIVYWNKVISTYNPNDIPEDQILIDFLTNDTIDKSVFGDVVDFPPPHIDVRLAFPGIILKCFLGSPRDKAQCYDRPTVLLDTDTYFDECSDNHLDQTSTQTTEYFTTSGWRQSTNRLNNEAIQSVTKGVDYSSSCIIQPVRNLLSKNTLSIFTANFFFTANPPFINITKGQQFKKWKTLFLLRDEYKGTSVQYTCSDNYIKLKGTCTKKQDVYLLVIWVYIHEALGQCQSRVRSVLEVTHGMVMRSHVDDKGQTIHSGGRPAITAFTTTGADGILDTTVRKAVFNCTDSNTKYRYFCLIPNLDWNYRVSLEEMKTMPFNSFIAAHDCSLEYGSRQTDDYNASSKFRLDPNLEPMIHLALVIIIVDIC